MSKKKNKTKLIRKKKNLGGRPTVLVGETLDKLESLLKNGATVQQACTYADIHESTYYRALERDESFARKMESAKYYATLAAKQVVVKDIVKGQNVQTAKWWLEKKEPETFASGSGVQVNMAAKDMKIEFIKND